MTRYPKPQSGFTLIELMIVVAIVAVLASVAYPSYLDYVRKAHRAAAQSFLMNVAAKQQQYLIDARTYASSLTDLALTAPSDVSRYYDIGFSPTSTATTFNVVATSTGTQAADLGGAKLELDQGGTKKPAGVW